MEILHILTGPNEWDIFRSDRPCKIGTLLRNEACGFVNFTADEYPYTNGRVSWRQIGFTLSECQEAVLRNWPKFCKTADLMDEKYNHPGAIKHGHHE